jgi:hypothetical protein
MRPIAHGRPGSVNASISLDFQAEPEYSYNYLPSGNEVAKLAAEGAWREFHQQFQHDCRLDRGPHGHLAGAAHTAPQWLPLLHRPRQKRRCPMNLRATVFMLAVIGVFVVIAVVLTMYAQ